MKTREEIDNKFKIDLSSLFKNDEEFISVLDAVEKDIELVMPLIKESFWLTQYPATDVKNKFYIK